MTSDKSLGSEPSLNNKAYVITFDKIRTCGLRGGGSQLTSKEAEGNFPKSACVVPKLGLFLSHLDTHSTVGF